MFVVLGISRSFGILETKPNSRTMKSIIFALALVAIAAAAPAGEPVVKPVAEPVAKAYYPEPVDKDYFKTLRSSFNQDPEGSYVFGFETEDGTSRDETGELKEVLDEEKKPHTVVIVKGSYSYTDPLGKFVNIVYYADENGFVAEGDSIPKSAEAPVSRR